MVHDIPGGVSSWYTISQEGSAHGTKYAVSCRAARERMERFLKSPVRQRAAGKALDKDRIRREAAEVCHVPAMATLYPCAPKMGCDTSDIGCDVKHPGQSCNEASWALGAGPHS